jgi:hypothetical protein
MPNANTVQEHMSQRPRRDVELCKVVFTAAVSAHLVFDFGCNDI